MVRNHFIPVRDAVDPEPLPILGALDLGPEDTHTLIRVRFHVLEWREKMGERAANIQISSVSMFL